jgi:hypothetical protein
VRKASSSAYLPHLSGLFGKAEWRHGTWGGNRAINGVSNVPPSVSYPMGDGGLVFYDCPAPLLRTPWHSSFSLFLSAELDL